MKIINVREAKNRLSEAIEASQGEHVVITRHGRPVALLRGVEGHDLEDVFYMTDPKFWKMIERAREVPDAELLGHEDVWARLDAKEKPSTATPSRPPKRKPVAKARKRKKPR
jgi:prevent-host-death family protein